MGKNNKTASVVVDETVSDKKGYELGWEGNSVVLFAGRVLIGPLLEMKLVMGIIAFQFAGYIVAFY